MKDYDKRVNLMVANPNNISLTLAWGYINKNKFCRLLDGNYRINKKN